MSHRITSLGVDGAPASQVVFLYVFVPGKDGPLEYRMTPQKAREVAVTLMSAADVASAAACPRCGKSSLSHEFVTGQCP